MSVSHLFTGAPVVVVKIGGVPRGAHNSWWCIKFLKRQHSLLELPEDCYITLVPTDSQR